MNTENSGHNFGIIGKSKALKDLLDVAQQVASSNITVLLYGESGTGKEVFARAIHQASPRNKAKLVSVNCGAIPEGLLESELFGHKKGAFTGAVEDRKGYFEIADGGTLFLDEIAEMPLTTQVRLLRVLETREFMPIGSEKLIRVDVRIIAATNRDLQKEVDAKTFRKDLYFRLKAVTLNIPPLRERREDIPPLAEHFLQSFSEKNSIKVPEISADGFRTLTSYPWPGNVRELKNLIETAVALDRKGYLDTGSFEPLLLKEPDAEPQRMLPVRLNKSPESLDREMIYRALFEIKKDLMELKDMAYKNVEPSKASPEIMPLEILEKDAIVNSLSYTRGNKRKAAKMLKISERTLYRKLKEYDIE